MRKADEHGGRPGATAAMRSSSPARSVAASRDTTTIGRYIARFRYEQPLPREKRAGVQKEDFWWKSGGAAGSSPTAAHRRLRLRQQQQPQHQLAPEYDVTSSLNASNLSDSSALGSSVASGYDRYIPEFHREQANEYEAYDTVIPGREQHPVTVSGSGALDGGGADAALLLSSLSASWDSVPSHLEPPSSSANHESILHEPVVKLPSRRWEHEAHAAGHHRLYTTSYEEANVMTEMAHDEQEQEEAKVEDAELVIERVRKRLGWSSSDSGGSERSLTFQYDAPSPSPHHTIHKEWRRPHGRWHVDEAFPHFSATEASPARSNGEEDDGILVGTMRRVDDKPVSDQSLELVLSELSNSEALRRDSHDQQSRFDAVDFYSASRNRAIDTNGEGKTLKPSDQDAHRSSSPRVSLANDTENTATNQVPAFAPSDVRDNEINRRSKDGVAQMEPLVVHAQAHHDTTGDIARIDDPTSRIPAIDKRENSSVEEDATPVPSTERAEEDQRELKAVEVPLQSAASPVLPPWRRSSRASSSASPSFSPRDDFAPLLSPRPSPSPTSLSSQSSVTADTAKTLDGLVSLVVQSWSSDFFIGGALNSVDPEDLTAESRDRSPAPESEEATEGARAIVVQDRLENVPSPREGNGIADSFERVEEAPDPSPVALSQENSSPVARVEPGAVTAAVAVDDESTSDPVGLFEATETQEEEGEHEDDEIVQLLLARIALYEQALRRLDQEANQEEVGNPA